MEAIFRKLARYSWLIRIIVSILVLSVLFKVIDLDQLLSISIKLSTKNIVIIILIVILRNYWAAIRFKVLVQNDQLTIKELGNQYFISSFFNSFLPTALGGDGIRILLLNKNGLSKMEAGFFILTERYVGFYALTIISYVSVLFWEAPYVIKTSVQIIFFSYTCIIFLSTLIFNKKMDIPFLNKFLGSKKLAPLIFVNRYNQLLVLLLFSLVYQLMAIYISYYIAIAIGLNPSALHYLTIVPVVYILTMLPISFGGIGVREVSFAYFFSLVGVSYEASTAISLGTYFALLFGAVIGGIIILINDMKLQ